MPEISVIVPVYNAMDFLDVSIRSVLQQTYTDFELILVDDGSTDDSWYICKKYESMDARVRAFHIEKQGVSAARNTGISEAKGKFIRFIDADDLIAEDSLERLIEPIKENDGIDLVLGNYDTNSELYRESIEGLYPVTFMIRQFLAYLSSFYYGVVWNKLYRASIIRSNLLEFEAGLQWSEDFLFNIRYFEYCDYVFFEKRSVYFYNRHALSLANVAYYSALDSIRCEIMRYDAIRALLAKKMKDDSLGGKAYEFFLSRINVYLSDVWGMSETGRKKYEIFCSVLEEEGLRELVCSPPCRSEYFINHVMICMIRKRRYRLLYVLFYFIHKIRKNRKISGFLKQFSWLYSKFPL